MPKKKRQNNENIKGSCEGEDDRGMDHKSLLQPRPLAQHFGLCLFHLRPTSLFKFLSSFVYVQQKKTRRYRRRRNWSERMKRRKNISLKILNRQIRGLPSVPLAPSLPLIKQQRHKARNSREWNNKRKEEEERGPFIRKPGEDEKGEIIT